MFIVVGVTGGIAAYKTVQLVRLLVLDGHDVHVVPTEDALRFVGTPTWEAISRNPVTTSVHDDVAKVRHVALGQSADLVVIAPATANSLAKMSAGLADDLLGTSLLATTAPVVVAPAMHTEMWRHPATQHNIGVLRERGVHIAGPAEGALTGGDSGQGRMVEPAELHATLRELLNTRHDLAGLHVAVSAGGTREPIDPVRFIGNRSSGRQGVAVALAAASRGARVTLVCAHVEADVLREATAHAAVETVSVMTAEELGVEMDRAAADADVVVMAAAVADYRVARASDHKLSKSDPGGSALTLDLVENPDILARLAHGRRPGQTIVGFAAETPRDGEDLSSRARAKLQRKGADLLVVNEVGWTKGFENPDNAVTIIGARDDSTVSAAGSKRTVADAVWDAVLDVRTAGGDASPTAG